MTEREALFADSVIEPIMERAKNSRSKFLMENSIAVLGGFGSIVVGAALLVGVTSQPAVGNQQILEATVRMERLATRLARAQTITPETADQIAQLMQLPKYDCGKAVCLADVDRRNRSARARLQAVMAKSLPPTKEPQEIAAREVTPAFHSRVGAQ